MRHITPDHISRDQLINEMNGRLTFPGVANAWTMPIRGRIDMLTTGIRTPLGLKIFGADVKVIDAIGTRIASALASIKGTRNVIAERIGEGKFLDFNWNREDLARYGLSIVEAQAAVQNAGGGAERHNHDRRP